ncbi:MAG: hypothetical protein ACI9VT_003719, partial [Psychroserpens sp.]
MTMNTLNQVLPNYGHEQFVCDALKDQIKAAQAHINTTRTYLVHI